MSIQEDLPKSRITLTYRTTINGEAETVSLPLRLLVLGDFSKGKSKDQKDDLQARKLRSISARGPSAKKSGPNKPPLDALMEDMEMTLGFEVPNRINPDVEENLAVTLPITHMKSFHPDEVVRHVPKLRALQLLKKLLVEMQSSIDNQKVLRGLIYDLFSDKAALTAVLTELKAYESLSLPPTAADKPVVDPNKPVVDPNKPVVDPNKPVVDPNKPVQP
ncbi:type VI secretion system contractile sheath small subunit [Pyxidicoccus sp. 3LFB2]